ncbi:hypothetical protein U6B65_07170 [Oscillospiraceae bacterium MB08-C2-2]|nr:hypothetical protein U6B65_07170 [Oscillospiraceae bacterium MB08-C2-2]
MNKKLCIYCGKPAETRDHVPPKCFLDEPYPAQLKTVSACLQCNNGFSKDEDFIMYLSDYLLSIELYGGDFTRKKAEVRFSYNDNLEDRICKSIKLDKNGVYFDFEHDRIVSIINKIAMGLLYLNLGSKKEIAKSNFIVIPQLSSSQRVEFDCISWKVVQENRFQYFISDTLVYFVINNILLCIVQHT